MKFVQVTFKAEVTLLVRADSLKEDRRFERLDRLVDAVRDWATTEARSEHVAMASGVNASSRVTQ